MRAPWGLLGFSAAIAATIGAGCNGSGADVSSGVGGDTSSVAAVSTGEGVVQGGQVAVGTGTFPPPPTFWLHAYGDSSDQTASALAVNAEGDIALSGTAKGTIDFGNIPWAGSDTDTDVVVVKLSSAGQALWSRRFGDSCDQRASAAALSAGGNVLVAGDFCGKMDFGTTTVETQAGEVDAFVALFDTLGEDIYSLRIGGKGNQVARAAAIDADGNAILVGSFDGALDDGSGGGPVPTAGKEDAFVIKLDPAGKLLWSERFGGPGADVALAVAVDAMGNIVVGGSFHDGVDFGGGPLTAAPPFANAFVVELDPGGKHLFSRRYGDGGNAVTSAVAVGLNGTIALTGFFDGAIDVGAGATPSAGGQDVFLTAIDGTAALLWGHTFGGVESEAGTGVAIGDDGIVKLTCTAREEIDFGAGNVLSAQGSPAASTIDIVRFDVSGNVFAARVVSSETPMLSVGVGSRGTLGNVVAGSFHGSLTHDDQTVKSAGEWDMFVLRDL
jgi:hypothetical protein